MTNEEKQEDMFFELLNKLQDAQQMLFDMGRIYATAYVKRKAIPVDYDQMAPTCGGIYITSPSI